MFCLRNYWSPPFALVRGGTTVGHPLKFNSVVVSLILFYGVQLVVLVLTVWPILIQLCNRFAVPGVHDQDTPVCGKLIKGLSNVKEEVYGALDSFVAWELEFPLIVVKKALKALEDEKEWKRIIQVIKWMFNKGQGKTMGSYYTLLNALIEDGRIEEAEELFGMIFSRYMEGLPRTFFMKMISLYYSVGAYDKMFEVFADMEELGVRPDGSIVRMLGDVFQKLEMMDKYEKLKKKYPPPKLEYRYIKGKRIRMKVYPNNTTEEATKGDPITDELEEAESIHLDNELEEAASSGLDRNVLDDAASGDLEYL
ncbi:unnamed protein product [Urochloa decumbens]|uniref:Pentatricopeptide repeat-containing protein n=1 Tax=Urochloa decumbens TaxID=240449 RepID=A0ABC8ZGI9_9POAL